MPALTVAFVMALVEGLGLLLVPLLGAIGLVVAEGPTTGVATWTTRAFAWMGWRRLFPAVLAVFLGVSIVHATVCAGTSCSRPRWSSRSCSACARVVSRHRVGTVVVLVDRRMSDLGHALLADMDR